MRPKASSDRIPSGPSTIVAVGLCCGNLLLFGAVPVVVVLVVAVTVAVLVDGVAARVVYFGRSRLWVGIVSSRIRRRRTWVFSIGAGEIGTTR